MVVNSVIESPQLKDGYQWELDWPAILYAPVIDSGRSAIGLLVLGCRRDHWYTDDEVGYAQSLGLTLAPMVAALRGPLSRLTPAEGEVAQLLSYGLSSLEVARAIQLDEHRARAIIDAVARKLQSVDADELLSARVPARRRVFRAMTW